MKGESPWLKISMGNEYPVVKMASPAKPVASVKGNSFEKHNELVKETEEIRKNLARKKKFKPSKDLWDLGGKKIAAACICCATTTVITLPVDKTDYVEVDCGSCYDKVQFKTMPMVSLCRGCGVPNTHLTYRKESAKKLYGKNKSETLEEPKIAGTFRFILSRN